jgi:PilZ domain
MLGASACPAPVFIQLTAARLPVRMTTESEPQAMASDAAEQSLKARDAGGETTRRRSDRILTPIRIRVIGNDMNGVSFSEDTVTISVNQQGARISLTHPLLPDDTILILNKQTNVEEEFRVVGAFQQVIGDRREWGVEAINPENNIWGIEFTQPAESLAPKAIIECAACRKVLESPMSSIEYDVLLATGLISRHCDRCNETTRWRPSDQVVLPEMLKAIQVSAPNKERRKARRIRLVMRVRVRNSWGVTDVAQTRDVSKSGLCFFSIKVFSVGDEVSIILPFAFNQVPVETNAKIVWSEISESGRYYGVEYIR